MSGIPLPRVIPRQIGKTLHGPLESPQVPAWGSFVIPAWSLAPQQSASVPLQREPLSWLVVSALARSDLMQGQTCCWAGEVREAD